MIALRRCELAEGRLPERLDSLVPRYLAAVPRDPFDSAPLRWDATTGALYSVGADLADDHGSFSSPARSGDRDLGMRYGWMPESPAGAGSRAR